MGWGIGIAIFGLLIISIYPQFEGQLDAFNIDEIEFYQLIGDFGDFAQFPGFVAAEMFVFIPILLAIYAITNGTGTLAGEEDDGTLEPLMALPLHRWQLVTTKVIALGIALFAILLIGSAGELMAYVMLPSDVNLGGVGASDLLVATIALWPLIMVFASLSLFLGAFMPSRRLAAAVATLILVITYFGNNLSGMVEFLEKIKWIFPFNYHNGQAVLENGVDIGDALVLLGISLVFFLLALISFQRRNVTVGAWLWQRPQIPGEVRA